MEADTLSDVILNTMSEQVYVRDFDKNLLFVNRAAEELTGWLRHEALGRKCYEVFGDAGGKCCNHCPVDEAIARQQPVHHQEGELVTRSGSVRKMRVSITPTSGVMSRNAAAIVMMQDVTEEQHLQKLLVVQRDLGIQLSQTDKLDKALSLCCKASLQLEEVDCAGMYLIDQNDGSLHLASHVNLPDWFVEKTSYYSSDTSHAQNAKRIEPCFSNYDAILKTLQLREDDVVLRQKAGLMAFSIIPIRHNKNTIATLNSASLHVNEFSKFTRDALQAIATQIGGTLLKISSIHTLKESQKNLKILFDDLEDLLFVVDFDGNIISTNQKVTDKLGYSQSKLRSMHILDLAPADIKAKATAKLAEIFEGNSNRADLPMQSESGEIIPMETVVTIGTWNNKRALLGLTRDISERLAARETLRASEERARADLKEKEVLLREIHHRVKNNMQVISSLLYLQGIKSPDENTKKALEEAESRVHSMALVHEILYQSKTMACINLQTYLEQLTEHVKNSFLDTALVDIHVNTGPLELKMEQSITCGLILTELLINSLKHAFGNTSTGKIEIVATPLIPPYYQLMFSDNGSGVDSEQLTSTSSTLGLRLVRELVKDQLEGTISLEQAEGTCWRIVWPVQAI